MTFGFPEDTIAAELVRPPNYDHHCRQMLKPLTVNYQTLHSGFGLSSTW